MGYVLVVDDVPAVREPIALVLDRAGFPTKTAANGAPMKGGGRTRGAASSIRFT
jgi:CheY-like chemotaxis protein